MPMYDYECPVCYTEFEKLQPVNDRWYAVCPNCGDMADKKVTVPTAVHYKGTGWFCKDGRY